GIPVVYYGDEQGFTGDGNDIAAREDMFPSNVISYNDNDLMGTEKTTADENFDTHHPIYKAIAKFSQLRSDHQTLRRGHYQDRFYQDGNPMFAFSRVDPMTAQDYLVIFNSGETAQSITLDSTGITYQPVVANGDLDTKNTRVIVSLPRLSFAVYKSKPSTTAANSSK
ncbi:MAG: hypothetical protein KUG78_09555, partial [Kangiellaceae bacterium]|nr:hypothetical protein [Kangiellaceae bacterium]